MHKEHVAFDLAGYAVNTQSLYRGAQDIMWHIARTGGDYMSHGRWIGHAMTARQQYQREIGEIDSLAFNAEVIADVAMRIADHYAEEYATTVKAVEIAKSAVRLDNDVNGNPRYYIPVFLFDKRPRNVVKYRGKKYGAGYVYQSYSLEHDIKESL